MQKWFFPTTHDLLVLFNSPHHPRIMLPLTYSLPNHQFYHHPQVIRFQGRLHGIQAKTEITPFSRTENTELEASTTSQNRTTSTTPKQHTYIMVFTPINGIQLHFISSTQRRKLSQEGIDSHKLYKLTAQHSHKYVSQAKK